MHRLKDSASTMHIGPVSRYSNPPLINGGPFSLRRCPFPARGARACFASGIEWPVVLDSAMIVDIQCSMFNALLVFFLFMYDGTLTLYGRHQFATFDFPFLGL